jgi:hypothetical protein
MHPTLGRQGVGVNPSTEVLGTYRVDVDDRLLDEAFELKYGGLKLSRREKKEALRSIREELAGVVLVEVIVRDRDERFDVADFQQAGSDQAPYDEAFLSEDGSRVVSRSFQVPPTEPLRITFFLHFFDSRLPLQSSYGDLPLPALQEMPGRLRELVPYEPVD